MSHEESQEKTYWSREMASLLKIGGSTLRKWCGVLEDQGCHFMRDEQGRRAFTENDALCLRYFKDLTMDKGISLDVAAKLVVERFGGAPRSVAASATPEIERYAGAIEKLLKHVEQQERFNKELLQRLDDRERYIDQILFENNEKILLAINEKEKKRKKWWWFTGK